MWGFSVCLCCVKLQIEMWCFDQLAGRREARRVKKPEDISHFSNNTVESSSVPTSRVWEFFFVVLDCKYKCDVWSSELDRKKKFLKESVTSKECLLIFEFLIRTVMWWLYDINQCGFYCSLCIKLSSFARQQCWGDLLIHKSTSVSRSWTSLLNISAPASQPLLFS